MGIVYFIFPETRGLGLEEVAQVFGEDISDGYAAGENALHYGIDDTIPKPSVSHDSKRV